MAARRPVFTVVGMSFTTASASLSDLADRRAAATPGAPCLADSAAVLSNADVRDRVHGVARTFADLGVGRGDVVAVMLPNRVELLVALLAAWRLGAAVTPINPALTPSEAQHQLTDSGAKVLVNGDGSAGLTGVVSVAAGDLPTTAPDDLPGKTHPVVIYVPPPAVGRLASHTWKASRWIRFRPPGSRTAGN